MNEVTSRDGTTIAFDRMGDGSPLIIVGGQLCDRAVTRPTAEEMAKRFTVFNYDRRGRGDSGDTLPYSVEREIEDIEALIDEAGGTASVYGHSSGAALALHAAAHDLPIAKLVLHEPPYTPDSDEEMKRASRKDAEHIKNFLAEDRRSDAIEYILKSIGMPEKMVEGMSHDPRTVAMAHTMAYDSAVMGDMSRGGTAPFDLAERVRVPALVLVGGASPAWMIEVGRQIAEAMPDGHHRVLVGEEHVVDSEILAPVLSEFFVGKATVEERRS